MTVYMYYLLLVSVTLIRVGRKGCSSSHYFSVKTSTFVFPPNIIYFYKVYLNTVNLEKLENSAPILSVPPSIFDVLHFPEEATDLPVNFLLFFCHFPEDAQCLTLLASSAQTTEVLYVLLFLVCSFPLPADLSEVSCSRDFSKVLGLNSSLFCAVSL